MHYKRLAAVAEAIVIDRFIGGDGSLEGTRTLRTRLPGRDAPSGPAIHQTWIPRFYCLSKSDFRVNSEGRIMGKTMFVFGERNNMKKQDLLSPASEASARSQESGRKTGTDADLGYRVILVPIDFSEHSKRTVEYAVRFAARYNAHIRLLHVFQIPDYAVTQYEHRQQGCEELKNHVDRAEEEAQENLNALENQLLNEGVNAKAYLRVGYPFEEIVLMANDPELTWLSLVRMVALGSNDCLSVAPPNESWNMRHALCWS